MAAFEFSSAHRPPDCFTQLQPIFQAEAYQLVAVHNDFLYQFVEQLGIEAVQITVTLDTTAPVIQSVTLTPNPVDAGATYIITVAVGE